MKCHQVNDPAMITERETEFIELGFSKEEAEKLAKAKNVDGQFWRVDKVQRMIDHKDCDHRLAVELIT